MIPKVIVKFDEEKDLKNIWETCNKEASYGYSWKNSVSKNILEICEGKKYEACKPKLKKVMSYIYKSPLNKIIVKAFNDAWEKVEKEYFKRLEKITGTKFPCKKIEGYITTAGRCPYNYNKKNPHFYIQFFSNILGGIHTAGHELMHIHLHNANWWKNVEKEIGNGKTHDLKEALTIILDIDFLDLFIIKGHGYPNHKELRKYIKQEWKKNKNFDKLTKKCIKWIKKNGVK